MRAHHLAYPVDRLHDGVVKIIDYWNSEASFEELHDGVGAYETGTTGYQNLLGGWDHFEEGQKEIMESEREKWVVGWEFMERVREKTEWDLGMFTLLPFTFILISLDLLLSRHSPFN